MSEPKNKHPQLIVDILKEKVHTLSLEVFSAKGKRIDTIKKELEKISLQMNFAIERSKNYFHLSDGAKTNLCDIYTSMLFERREDIESKYLEKGLMLEEDAITMYSLLVGKMFKKNKTRKFNDFLEGEMDIEDDEMVIDTKVSWSIFTFNRVAARPIKVNYNWQLNGYMWLWKKKKARLVYALINTPDKFIKMEEKKLLYNFVGSEDEFQEACKELRYLHTYDDIPLDKRIRTIDINFDPLTPERVEEKVVECRRFLNFLLEQNINISENDLYENQERYDNC